MDILKIFNLYDNEIKINIIGTIENPLFQANQIGKLLGLRNIRESIKNFDEDERYVSPTDTGFGVKDTIFLTEIGLYRLLGMSRKEEARIFQKWIYNVVKELRLTGKYELEATKEDDRRIYNRKIELERHKTLITSFDKKHVIYICILDNHRNFENSDSSIYKIGFSNNFKRRLYELEKTYGPITLLYMYEAENNIEFEKFLFDHKDISKFKYKKNLIKNHNTRELFLLSLNDLNNILNIINNNIKDYKKISKDEYIKLKEIELENNKIKLQVLKIQNNDDTKSEITELSESEDIEIEELNEFKPKLEYEYTEGDTLYDIRKINNSRSPYIQKYDPNTLELLESFDSLIDLTRINENISKSGLKNAAKSNTIYNGFRWLLIDKSEPNIKYNLEPTVDIRIQKHNEFIAMLDINKKKIVEVFASQKEASASRNFTNGAAICAAIKKGNISSGHYWLRYNDCSEELKSTYTKPLPNKNKASHSRKVEIINKTTKEIIKVFDCIEDVLKEFQMSRLSLNKASNSKEAYKGFIFNIVE